MARYKCSACSVTKDTEKAVWSHIDEIKRKEYVDATSYGINSNFNTLSKHYTAFPQLIASGDGGGLWGASVSAINNVVTGTVDQAAKANTSSKGALPGPSMRPDNNGPEVGGVAPSRPAGTFGGTNTTTAAGVAAASGPAGTFGTVNTTTAAGVAAASGTGGTGQNSYSSLFACNQCPKKFSSIESLAQHQQAVHKNVVGGGGSSSGGNWGSGSAVAAVPVSKMDRVKQLIQAQGHGPFIQKYVENMYNGGLWPNATPEEMVARAVEVRNHVDAQKPELKDKLRDKVMGGGVAADVAALLTEAGAPPVPPTGAGPVAAWADVERAIAAGGHGPFIVEYTRNMYTRGMWSSASAQQMVDRAVEIRNYVDSQQPGLKDAIRDKVINGGGVITDVNALLQSQGASPVPGTNFPEGPAPVANVVIDPPKPLQVSGSADVSAWYDMLSEYQVIVDRETGQITDLKNKDGSPLSPQQYETANEKLMTLNQSHALSAEEGKELSKLLQANASVVFMGGEAAAPAVAPADGGAAASTVVGSMSPETIMHSLEDLGMTLRSDGMLIDNRGNDRGHINEFMQTMGGSGELSAAQIAQVAALFEAAQPAPTANSSVTAVGGDEVIESQSDSSSEHSQTTPADGSREQKIAQINEMNVSQQVKDAAIQQVKDGSPLSAPDLVRFYSAQQPKQMGGGMPRMESPHDSLPMQIANPNQSASGAAMPGKTLFP